MAHVKDIAFGSKVALAGGPIAGAAPIFFGVKEDEQDEDDHGTSCQPNESFAEEVLHRNEGELGPFFGKADFRIGRTSVAE